MRIISLVPSITELLFDLGLDDEVVALTKFCVRPEHKFKSLPRVGGTKDVRYDVVASLKPDLIIANREENTQHDVERLMNDFSVHITDVRSVDDAFNMIIDVGGLTGRMDEAYGLVSQLEDEWQMIRGVAGGERVGYAIWENPLMMAGDDTFIDAVLNWCGWENVIKGGGRYPELNEEQLRLAAPERLFLSSEPFPFKEKHLQRFAEMLPETRIELVDGEVFSWYGSRLRYTADYVKRLL